MKFNYRPPSGSTYVDKIPGPDGVEYWYKFEAGHLRLFVYGAWGMRDAITTMAATRTRPFWDRSVKVHSGFYRQAHDIIGDMVFHFMAADSISLEGHSMGAAVAVIIGDYITKTMDREVHVHAFALPRCIGNSRFIRKYKPDITAYYNGLDIIQTTILLHPYLGIKPTKVLRRPGTIKAPWYKKPFIDHNQVSYMGFKYEE